MNSITDIIDNYINDTVPGVAVGVVKDGQIIYEQYFGYSNLDLRARIDSNTRFNIASNAKQFTALGILKLIDEGRLGLNDDFRKYLPGYYNKVKEKITISNLLTHTSGVRDYCDLLALKGKTWWKQFIDNGDVLDLLSKQQDLNFRPGKEYLYSNSNYILLLEIIKVVTEDNYRIFIEELFEGLEMSNTSFLANHMVIIPNRARPYGNWNGWKEIPVITNVHGDGALYTTLRDQLKWEQIIQLSNDEYLPKGIIEISQSPVKESPNNAYGYGLRFDVYGGLERIYHNGATGGYRASFSRFPSKGLSLVIMTNNRNLNIDALNNDILGFILDLREQRGYNNLSSLEKSTTTIDLNNFLGIYRPKNDQGETIRITKSGSSFISEIYRQAPVKIVMGYDGVFCHEGKNNQKLVFEGMNRSNQKLTIYSINQKPKVFQKISDLEMSGFDKTNFVGKFYNDETNTEIIISFKSGNKYVLTKNGRARDAQLVSPGYLRMMASYKIKVMLDDKDNVTGLKVDNGRNRNIIFNKI